MSRGINLEAERSRGIKGPGQGETFGGAKYAGEAEGIRNINWRQARGNSKRSKISRGSRGEQGINWQEAKGAARGGSKEGKQGEQADQLPRGNGRQQEEANKQGKQRAAGGQLARGKGSSERRKVSRGSRG
jgi:hypothetical protein